MLVFVLLGFAAVAAPAFVAFNWIAGSTITQLGTSFAEKQVLYDRYRGLGALTREIALAEALAGSQAIRDWALNEIDPIAKRRGIAELEHYRQNFADGSYFFVIDKSGHYYFNDAANGYADDQLRYSVSPDNPRDAWYFTSKALDDGCRLNVDNDANLRVTKVWMNCVIREGSQVLGVLGTGIDLSSFIQDVVNVPQVGVTSMFVDHMGLVQAHHDEALVNLASLSPELRDERTVFSLLDSPQDEATLRALMAEVSGGEALARSAFVNIEGKQTLVGVGYLDQLGWFNITLMDVDAIIDRRLFLPIGALLIVVIALVALMLMAVFKKTVLDRLVRLENVVRCARSGDYEPARTLAGEGNDEIGRLAEALSDMAEAVAANTQLLEGRVRERTHELEQLALRDGHTGALNRRGMAAVHSRIAGQQGYGLLLIDVDHFKVVNDTHGHAAGDAVVVEVARRIGKATGQGASCARWGGDEYLVLLPDASENLLHAAAYAVMAEITAEPIRVAGGEEIAISASIGVCLAGAADPLELAADRADAALYMAKAQGRNMVVVFDGAMDRPRNVRA